MTFNLNVLPCSGMELPVRADADAVAASAAVIWLLVVIFLAIIMLILGGWEPAVSVGIGGCAGVLAAKPRPALT
ncbi:hypothetical protein [Streptomyces sp. NPDC058418]|uniref:hypothetical protein n=1 Tax=Streptomyces sp. NPDC058418 TaxID=3346488 RepID=UPI003653A544